MRCVLSAPPLQISFKSRPFSNKAYSNSAELKLGLHFGDLRWAARERACGPARACSPLRGSPLRPRARSGFLAAPASARDLDAGSPRIARAKPAHGGFSAELNWEISLPIARAIFIPTKVAQLLAGRSHHSPPSRPFYRRIDCSYGTGSLRFSLPSRH